MMLGEAIMRDDKTLRIIISVFLVLIFGYYSWLRIDNSKTIREPRATFGDVHEYFAVSSFPITSSSFWIAVRPPTIPLLFKVIGTDVTRIWKFQFWFSILAWGSLALTVASVIHSYLVKPLAFSIVLAFSLSQEIVMWDYLIISESIAISIMALLFASVTLLLAEWNYLRLFLFGIAGLLFVLTRDAFAYFLLMAAFGLFLLIFFIPNRRYPFMVGTFLILLFLLSNALASASMRWYPSLLYTFNMRILPNPQYVEYFVSRGMPIDVNLLEQSDNRLSTDEIALVNDQDFRDWVAEYGKREYIRFLWFYKADALQNIFEDIQLLISPNLFYYSATGFNPIIKDARLDEILYPTRFGIFTFLIANLFAAASSVWAIYERKHMWLLPLLLILVSYPQAVFIWNADANEIGRHSLYHNIQWRLGLWLWVLCVIDFVVVKKNVFSPLLSLLEDRNGSHS